MSSSPTVSPEHMPVLAGGTSDKKKSRSKTFEVLNSSGIGDQTVAKLYKRDPRHR